MAKNQTFNLSLKLLTTQFEKGINKVQSQLRSFGNFIKSAFAITSVTAFTKGITDMGGEFENQMARVKAVSNATTKQFEMMRDKALEIGRTTRYSAQQAAEGLEILTRNGLSAEKAVAVLTPALNLAAANAIDLASAGDMVTNTLNMFGLSTSQSARVADVFSQACARSATDVNALYEAFINAGPTAASLGLSLEETAAALMTLANQGIKGADAGSKLAQAYSKLLSPKVQKDLRDLGININSDTIATKGLLDVVKQFANANLTPEQMVSVFGERAWRGINTLVKEVQSFQKNIEIAGTAAGTATRMAEQGIGDYALAVKELQNTWKDAMIRTFEKSKGVIIGVLNTVKNFITYFTSGIGVAITAIGVFGTVLSKTFRNARLDIQGTKSSISTMNGAMTILNGTIANNGATLAADIAQLEKYIVETKKLGGSTTQATRALKLLQQAEREVATQGNITAATTGKLKTQVIGLGQASKATAVAMGTGSAAARVFSTALTGLKTIGKSIFNFLGGWPGLIITAATAISSFLVPAIKNQNKAIKEANSKNDEAQASITKLTSKTKDLIKELGTDTDQRTLNGVVKRAVELFPDFQKQIEDAAKAANKTDGYENLKQVLNDILTLQTKVMGADAAKNQYEAYIDTMAGMMMGASKSEAEKAGLQPLRDYFKKNKTGKTTQKAIYSQLARMRVEGRSNNDINDYIKAATGGDVSMSTGWNSNMIKGMYKLIGPARDLKNTINDVNQEIQTLEEQLSDNTSGGGGKKNPNELEEIYKKLKNRLVQIQKLKEAGAFDSTSEILNEEGALKATVDALESYIDAVKDSEKTSVEDIKAAMNLTAEWKGQKLTLTQLREEYNKLVQSHKDFKKEITESGAVTKSGENLVEKTKKEYNTAVAREDSKTSAWDSFSLDPQEFKAQQVELEKLRNKLGRLESAYGKLTEEKRAEIEQNIAFNQSLKDNIEIWNRLTDAEKEAVNNSISKDTNTLKYFDELKTELDKASNKVDMYDNNLKLMQAEQDLSFKKWSRFDDSVSLFASASGLVENLANSFEKLAEGEADAFDVLNMIISSIQTISSIAQSIGALNNMFSGIKAGAETIGLMKSAVEGTTAATEALKVAEVSQNDAAIAGKNEVIGAELTEQGIIEGTTTATKTQEGIKAAADATAVSGEIAKTDAAATTAGAQAGAAAAGAASSQAAVPIIGPALAIAAAGLVLGVVMAAIAKGKKHASGGIVSGMKHGDKNLVRVNGGEMILNTQQQSRLFSMLNGRGTGGNSGGQVEFKISGKELKGVLNNYNAANSKITSTL